MVSGYVPPYGRAILMVPRGVAMIGPPLPTLGTIRVAQPRLPIVISEKVYKALFGLVLGEVLGFIAGSV